MRVFRAFGGWHGACHIYLESLIPSAKENAMKNVLKIEALMMQALFAASALICVLVMGSMLTAKAPVYAAASHAPVVAVTASKA